MAMMEATGVRSPVMAGDRRARARVVIFGLGIFLIVLGVCSLAIGATGTSLWQALSDLARGEAIGQRERIVLLDIRLPRMMLGMLVGAALAVSGVVLQGLFRNPLADPGLVGIGPGAGLGAITAIVLGGLMPVDLLAIAGNHLVAVAAFIGGWLTTLLLYRVSTNQGRTSVAVMLLAGIAMAALAGAVSGVMIYLADDSQLRDLTFWGLGSLAGATWGKVAAAFPLIALSVVTAPFLARALNALALGEAAAAHLGIPVQLMKRLAILSVAGAAGAAVAVSGGIGFVGIVVPHLLRLAIGPDHRFLIPASALLGAAMLIAADMIARSIVAPAELPIGIVTAILGGPFFLFILLRNRASLDI